MILKVIPRYVNSKKQIISKIDLVCFQSTYYLYVIIIRVNDHMRPKTYVLRYQQQKCRTMKFSIARTKER